MVKVTLGATIPVAQYANVQPSVEAEADTFDEAYAQAQAQIRTIWNDFCEKGKELKAPSGGAPTAPMQPKHLIELECIATKSTAYFDKDAHVYTDINGKPLVNASSIVDKFKTPFEPSFIIPKMVAKYDVPAENILATWELRKDASTEFGNAIHHALELYGKYEQDGKKMDKSMLCELPILAKIVEEFFSGREGEHALYEAFVTDGKFCGTIDRFLIVKPGVCRIQDYKTTPDLHKQGSPKMLKSPFENLPNTPLGAYTIQQNVYADIVERAGWTVEGIDIFHWNGEWSTIQVDRVPVLKHVDEEWVTAGNK